MKTHTDMSTEETIYLKRVKVLLIYLKVIKPTVTIHAESWLSYKNSGYTPINAVKEDIEGYYTQFPFIQWSELSKIQSNL